MKKTFLRILPLAVAVLLATSCSKDENNDNAVVNNGQENVQTKTMPISITVNQKGLSKLGCTGAIGENLQPIFKAGDKLAIYIKDGGKLKDLEVKEENITNDGKTAIFEGEIVGAGLVDKETVLTAEIGTQIQSAITATSREDAVQQGCYQISEPFVYSKDGNSIALEEQNAYIEVVWTNKGGATVPFTIADETVNLTLNGQGQGWIVVPAGQSFTCATLGITTEKTTEKANIYGINREFSAVPGGYVDLGVELNNQHIYFEKSDSYTKGAWQDEQEDWPTVAEWTALKDQCYWKLADDNGGYYVFKAHDNDDAGKVTNQSSTYTPLVAYSTATEPYIFLPVADGIEGYYWSSESFGDFDAFCLYFYPGGVMPGNNRPKGYNMPGVVTVRRSN